MNKRGASNEPAGHSSKRQNPTRGVGEKTHLEALEEQRDAYASISRQLARTQTDIDASLRTLQSLGWTWGMPIRPDLLVACVEARLRGQTLVPWVESSASSKQSKPNPLASPFVPHSAGEDEDLEPFDLDLYGENQVSVQESTSSPEDQQVQRFDYAKAARKANTTDMDFSPLHTTPPTWERTDLTLRPKPQRKITQPFQKARRACVAYWVRGHCSGFLPGGHRPCPFEHHDWIPSLANNQAFMDAEKVGVIPEHTRKAMEDYKSKAKLVRDKIASGTVDVVIGSRSQLGAAAPSSTVHG